MSCGGRNVNVIEVSGLKAVAAGKILCRETVDLLGGYHDGDLEAEQRTAVEAHLAGCRRCRQYLRSYRAAIELAKAAMKKPVQEEASDVLSEELVKAILAARARRK
jgi:anti-sigma factor RsiW